MAVAAEGSGGIGAEPVAAGFAIRIDALHREAGHELHFFSPRGRKAQIDSGATASRWQLKRFRAPLVGQDRSLKKSRENPSSKKAGKTIRKKCPAHRRP